MSSRHDKKILGLGVALACAGFVLPLFEEATTLGAVLYVLASSLLTLKLLDICVRYWLGAFSPGPGDASIPTAMTANRATHPFAVIMSVYNFRSKAQRILARLAPLKANTWIIDDGSDDDTAAYLEFRGWRCLRAATNNKKPAAIKTLLTRLPKEIRTVLVLDPDCEPLNSDVADLEHAIRRFQESGAAACWPRFRIREGGFLASLQLFETELAFLLGRKGMSPHRVTCGVSLYDRDALERALAEHSLCVYAEDLENALIILENNGSIQYDDRLVFTTEAKSTFTKWFSQRVGWSFGLIRVYSQCWRSVLHVARYGPWPANTFVVYLGLFTIVLGPLKLASVLLLAAGLANGFDTLLSLDLIPDNVITNPRYFAATYTTYTLLCVFLFAYARPRVRVSTAVTAIVFYPFYTAVHVLAMTIGYLNWFSYRFLGTRIHRDHELDEPRSDTASERSDH